MIDFNNLDKYTDQELEKLVTEMDTDTLFGCLSICRTRALEQTDADPNPREIRLGVLLSRTVRARREQKSPAAKRAATGGKPAINSLDDLLQI